MRFESDLQKSDIMSFFCCSDYLKSILIKLPIGVNVKSERQMAAGEQPCSSAGAAGFLLKPLKNTQKPPKTTKVKNAPKQSWIFVVILLTFNKTLLPYRK